MPIAISCNLKKKAPTQFCNYDFDTLCAFNGLFFWSNSDGLFTLSGEDDDGDAINAYFVLPPNDWGIENIKRIRSIFFGMETLGGMEVTVLDDEDHENVTAMPYGTYQKQASNKCNPGRNNNQGRYISIKVGNADGKWFAVDNITVLPVVLNRKPR